MSDYTMEYKHLREAIGYGNAARKKAEEEIAKLENDATWAAMNYLRGRTAFPIHVEKTISLIAEFPKALVVFHRALNKVTYLPTSVQAEVDTYFDFVEREVYGEKYPSSNLIRKARDDLNDLISLLMQQLKSWEAYL